MLLRTLAAIGLFLTATGAAQASQLLSDTWWNPNESGWSLVLEHQHAASHAMLHVYDDEGQARWYVAPLATTALTAEGLPLLQGVLYAAEGPPHGGPWNPDLVDVQPTGQLSIEPMSAMVLAVRYSIDGGERTATLQRLSVERAGLPGVFAATALLRTTGGNQPVETRLEQFQLSADFYEGAFGMQSTGGDSPCNYQGEVETLGRLTEIFGTYSCANGHSGPFRITELVETPHGFTGKLRRRLGERVSEGPISWLRY